MGTKVNVAKRGNDVCLQSKIFFNDCKYKEPASPNAKKVADLKKFMQYIPSIDQEFYLTVFQMSG